MYYKNILFSGIMLSCLIPASVFAECPFDRPCEQVYSFDLQKDFRSDAPESECGPPAKESYLSSSNNNNIFYDEASKSIQLIVTYKGATDKCGDSKRRFKTARLISNTDINSYYAKLPTNDQSNPINTGYIEFEAKMPACLISTPERNDACVGFWPGLWLFNLSDWRFEHDVLEMNYRYNVDSKQIERASLGYNKTSQQFYTSTEGYAINSTDTSQVQRKFGILTYVDLTEDFHKYGMRWSCDKNTLSCTIKFVFDGRLQSTITIDKNEDCKKEGLSFYMSPTEKTFCTKLKGVFDSFAPSTSNNLLHVILTIHVGNLGANQGHGTKTEYPFTPDDIGKELGRMSVKSIILYK